MPSSAEHVSIRFDQDLRLKREPNDPVGQLAVRIVEFSDVQTRGRTYEVVEECLSAVLANIYLAQEHGEEVWVAISQSSGGYTSSRYWRSELSYRGMMKVMNYMKRDNSGFAFLAGFQDRRRGQGRYSRIVWRQRLWVQIG